MSGATVGLKSIEPRFNILRLEHFFAIEKALMRTQGARIPDLESWHLKQKVGYFLYEDARHADRLRTRRRELRAGSRGFPPLPDPLRSAIEAVLHAPGDYLFCSALYLGVKPLLVQAYRQHLEESTIYSDHPTRMLFESIISEEERQIAWVEGALSLMPGVGSQAKKAGQEWVQRIQDWVQAAGGIFGEGPAAPERLPEFGRYNVTTKARREPRQKATFSFDTNVEAADEVQRALLIQFMAYFREMAAAETMGGLLWESPEDMPWEFFMDSARHFWDEIRHCQAGQQRLEELGLDIWDVPVQTGHYDARAHMPLLERYAFLTQVQEAESFQIKHENENLFRESGDLLSANMVAYDIADERNHVRYGTRWIPELQKVLGDNRTMDELVADSRKMQREIWKRLSGGEEAHPDGQY